MTDGIAAAARALAQGDVLGALKLVALREEPAALALRAIALAQLGEAGRARELLARAARAFGVKHPVERARCQVADAEVALSMRDLTGSPRVLLSAEKILLAHDDRVNALHARIVGVRRWLLLGRLDLAEASLQGADVRGAPPALLATAELAWADLALRRIQTRAAFAALERARAAAQRSGIGALVEEVEQARGALQAPAARLVRAGAERSASLAEVEELLVSGELVVDAAHRSLRAGAQRVDLRRRPIVFALLRVLAEYWPESARREVLIARAFGVTRPNASHRARLRVEVGRLRSAARLLARVEATESGFSIAPLTSTQVTVLVPALDGEGGALRALLSDGEAWSTSALALALGASQRTVQRALARLEAERHVRSLGQARARRWLAPPITGTTIILSLAALSPLE